MPLVVFENNQNKPAVDIYEIQWLSSTYLKYNNGNFPTANELFEGLIKEAEYQLKLKVEIPEYQQYTEKNIMKTWQFLKETAIKYLKNLDLN